MSGESQVVVQGIMDDVLSACVNLLGQDNSKRPQLKVVEAFEFNSGTTSESLCSESEMDIDCDILGGFTVVKNRKRHRRDQLDSANKVHIRSSSLDKEDLRRNLQMKAKSIQSAVNKDLSL